MSNSYTYRTTGKPTSKLTSRTETKLNPVQTKPTVGAKPVIEGQKIYKEPYYEKRAAPDNRTYNNYTMLNSDKYYQSNPMEKKKESEPSLLSSKPAAYSTSSYSSSSYSTSYSSSYSNSMLNSDYSTKSNSDPYETKTYNGSSLKKEKKADRGICGLRNIGNTCFM